MKAVVMIRLEMEGRPEDAYKVVDDILEAGMLQDAINENDLDAGVLKVTSATCVPPSPELTEEEREVVLDALKQQSDAVGPRARQRAKEGRLRRLAVVDSARAKLGRP